MTMTHTKTSPAAAFGGVRRTIPVASPLQHGRLGILVMVAISCSFIWLTTSAMAQPVLEVPIRQMSSAVESLCPQLKQNNQNLTAAETDLWFRCAELKIAPGNSFEDLSGDQKFGLLNMQSEETNTMGRLTVELSATQVTTLTGRLTTLRQKVGGGSMAVNDDAIGDARSLYAGPIFAMVQYEPTITNVEYGRFGVFLSGSGVSGDRDATEREAAFDFDGWDLVGGLDYRFADELFAGLAVGYSTTEAEIEQNLGDVDVDGYGFSLYGTYYVKNFYIDAIGTYAQRDYTTVRNLRYSVPKFAQDPTPGPVTNVNQSFVGDPGATDYDLFVGVGYNYYKQGFNLTPYLNLRYIDSQIDGYTERNQTPNTNSGFGLPLTVEEQAITSLTSRLGGQISYAVGTQAGILAPYVRFDWEHEFKNDERTFRARFASVGPQYDSTNVIDITTDAPDQDFFNLGLGMSATFPHGVMAYIDYATLLGLADTTSHRLAAGIRYEF